MTKKESYIKMNLDSDGFMYLSENDTNTYFANIYKVTEFDRVVKPCSILFGNPSPDDTYVIVIKSINKLSLDCKYMDICLAKNEINSFLRVLVLIENGITNDIKLEDNSTGDIIGFNLYEEGSFNLFKMEFIIKDESFFILTKRDFLQELIKLISFKLTFDLD